MSGPEPPRDWRASCRSSRGCATHALAVRPLLSRLTPFQGSLSAVLDWFGMQRGCPVADSAQLWKVVPSPHLPGGLAEAAVDADRSSSPFSKLASPVPSTALDPRSMPGNHTAGPLHSVGLPGDPACNNYQTYLCFKLSLFFKLKYNVFSNVLKSVWRLVFCVHEARLSHLVIQWHSSLGVAAKMFCRGG